RGAERGEQEVADGDQPDEPEHGSPTLACKPRGLRAGSMKLEHAKPQHPQTQELAMKKFMVLYQAPICAQEQMGKATPEQQKAGMDAWMAWSKKAGSAIVDLGQPLGNAQAVAKNGGTSKGTTIVAGYSVMQ